MTATMVAATVAAPGRVVVDTFPRPLPGAGDVLVRMTAGSICGSDVHVVFDGFHRPEMLGEPGYPGHEGVGVVEESRDPRFAPGELVLTVPPGAQGRCLAQFQVVPGSYLIGLPAEADPLRLLMAQQLGTTLFAMKRVPPASGTDVGVVIGAGSAGTYFVQHLRRLGFGTIVVADRNAERLATAKRLGATHTVLAPASVTDAVRDLTGGRGADLVIEAAGYDDCRADAIEAVRWQGTVVFFGYPERYGLAPYPSFLAFRRCVTIAWINGAQSEPGLASFREAVELIRSEEIEVDHCLQAMLPLADAPAALDLARAAGGGASKVGVVIG